MKPQKSSASEVRPSNNGFIKASCERLKPWADIIAFLEEDIERHLRSKLAAESRRKCGLGSDKISESNQLPGRILQIKVDGLMAQVTILAGEHELTSLITADVISELGLRTGVDVIALLKSSQIIILREPV